MEPLRLVKAGHYTLSNALNGLATDPYDEIGIL